ncbi:putative beta-lysine N-acetyltransferase [Salipaludibacillus aurantiacus]|uniref:Putative beta-lysine N-acetyltransferase n=1 Tax=Salipaludibacillus aurantiacus TaxID=1601833 RepID=A0A1H9P032_9BACI|nr:putative beta-lysine N-acetyltransferase [Salipaludibacillus aurantiacus]SER41481.1 putative beta-lysine N-acetyltransferase [Salipaludibacillus aurantiacus]
MGLKALWDVDLWNDRLVAYLPDLSAQEQEKVKEKIKNAPAGKFTVYTLENHQDTLLDLGFQHEADLPGFFEGKTAKIFSLFLKEERNKSASATKNKDVLNIVKNDKAVPSQSWKGILFSHLEESDLDQLTSLYKRVFDVYPTNIFDQNYIKASMNNNYTFVTAKDQGKVIGAASAMKTGYQSAEITDCAVDPDYRGRNILHGLILELETRLVKERIFNAFSITRAVSVGMNMTVKRLDYTYKGTLVNNCKISSGYEDMNIWVKKLKN